MVLRDGHRIPKNAFTWLVKPEPVADACPPVSPPVGLADVRPPVTSQPRTRGSQDTPLSARPRAVASTRSAAGRVFWARLVPAQRDDGFSWEDTEPVESLGSAVKSSRFYKSRGGH